MHSAKCIMHNLLRSFCILHCAFVLGGCSIPSLESRACADARVTAKQFYSLHLTNDMRPSTEYRDLRRRFLTRETAGWLEEDQFQTVDMFTGVQNDDPRGYPNAFKIGRCTGADSAPDDNVFLQVQLYWHQERREGKDTLQSERTLEMTRINGAWLIVGALDGYRR